MTEVTLHGWAETAVYPVGKGGKDSPEHGDQCPICEEPLNEGERVHRVVEAVAADKWVHCKHVWREGGPDRA